MGPARAAVLFVSLGLSLLVVEGGLRAFEHLSGSEESAVFADGAHQSESRRSSNPVLVWELDPAGAEVNSGGFRDREASRTPRPGIVRIVLLGDSIAFGHGLPVEQGVADQLEVALGAGYEVLNFGVGGYNTRQTAEHYAMNARLYNPDIVVLLYVLNDGLPAERMAALADLVADIRRQADQPTSGSALVRYAGRAIDTLRGQDADATAPYVRETHRDERTWQMIERGLERTSSLAKADGARLLLVITPLFFDLDPYVFEDVHAQVADAGRRKGFAVLDLTPALRSHDARDLRLDPEDVTHPNALGHRVMAEAIAREIEGLPSQ